MGFFGQSQGFQVGPRGDSVFPRDNQSGVLEQGNYSVDAGVPWAFWLLCQGQLGDDSSRPGKLWDHGPQPLSRLRLQKRGLFGGQGLEVGGSLQSAVSSRVLQ